MSRRSKRSAGACETSRYSLPGCELLRCAETATLVARRRDHHIEQHQQLVVGQRELRRVPADDLTRGGNDVVSIEQGVGQRDSKLVHLARLHHVAEVDQADDGRSVDQHVVIVRVVMHHGHPQTIEHRCHSQQMPVEGRLDQSTVGPVGDRVGPGAALLRGVQVPQEVGAVRCRMGEAGQRRRQAPDELAELPVEGEPVDRMVVGAARARGTPGTCVTQRTRCPSHVASR